jgi:hypothetical protein
MRLSLLSSWRSWRRRDGTAVFGKLGLIATIQAPAFVFAKGFDPSSTDYGSFTSAGGYYPIA